MTDTLNPEHVEWCRGRFNLLGERGIWAVPRSGLVFQRRGSELVLIDRMPHIAGMPFTPEELRAYQDDDLADHRQHFGAAGITIRDET